MMLAFVQVLFSAPLLFGGDLYFFSKFASQKRTRSLVRRRAAGERNESRDIGGLRGNENFFRALARKKFSLGHAPFPCSEGPKSRKKSRKIPKVRRCGTFRWPELREFLRWKAEFYWRRSPYMCLRYSQVKSLPGCPWNILWGGPHQKCEKSPKNTKSRFKKIQENRTRSNSLNQLGWWIFTRISNLIEFLNAGSGFRPLELGPR